jgi:CRISPR system Cascade subunit CasE
MTGDLWLSLIELDQRHRVVRAALGDARARHRIVLAGFPGATSRQQAGVLYSYTPPTADQPPQLVVQSTTKPDWSHLPGQQSRSIPQVQDIARFWDQVSTAEPYLFRLTASPCRGVGGHGGNRIRGTRTPIPDPIAQVDWLARILSDAADLGRVQVTAPVKTTGRQHGRTITLTSVTFSGELALTNPTRLREQAVAGIGPGKAYGNGLLTIATAPRVDRPTRRDIVVSKDGSFPPQPTPPRPRGDDAVSC